MQKLQHQLVQFIRRQVALLLQAGRVVRLRLGHEVVLDTAKLLMNAGL